MIIHGDAGRNYQAGNACITNPSPHSITYMFVRIKQRLREIGNFQARSSDCGAQSRRTLDFEKGVLHHVQKHPSTNARNIAHGMNVPHTRFCRILYDQQLHPYHPQKVHTMGPGQTFCHVSISVHGFYNIASTFPDFIAALFSRMRFTSPGR